MLRQYSTLGFSVYPSTWSESRKQLSSLHMEGSAVFTSLHIHEEMDEHYVGQAGEMLKFLKETGYRIIADVSEKTLEVFQEENLISLARRFDIDILRIDYGFSFEEIQEVAVEVPVCLNASTITKETARKLKDSGNRFYAMHNFYPRPETGLDEKQFMERNEMLRSFDIEVMAFIPGADTLRGPIFAGLPTLEKHRGVMPYEAFIDMQNTYEISEIFVGDGILSEEAIADIQRLVKDNVYNIKVSISEENRNLLEKKFTVRIDSPKTMIRIAESRGYAATGEKIEPINTFYRNRGSITIDNQDYKRYSGEVQILRDNFPKDQRVNVIGEVDRDYLSVLDLIPNGAKIILTEIEIP